MRISNELKNYTGSAQKPDNFDLFWDNKLKQIKNHDFKVEITQKSLPSKVANFYDLWFIAIDGAKIHAQLITPKDLTQRYPGILQFHGYHCDSGDWVDKVGAVAEGNVVLALDCRGQGGPSEDNTKTSGMTMKGLIVRGIEEGYENLYYVCQYMDLASAAKIFMALDYVDETNITARGASQGGGLTIACAALVPEIKRAIATYPFLSDYRKAYDLGAQTSAFEEIPYWFQFQDPLHLREDWFFNQLEYIDVQNLATRIKAEVFWIYGGMDTIVPPITQMATYNKITAPKHLYVLPEYGHEYLPAISDYLATIL
ncbi:acetylxylan esterase [Lactococcus nasutitermitis]|uniref:Acetylxylan esterase n=1 Tax=Lactococcus nasutitermitis TaxID=1652957 RepID=A0ABV9JGS4_9LACT|nr:acetylxylan esterase [Lactococcus nasutitermitis]